MKFETYRELARLVEGLTETEARAELASMGFTYQEQNRVLIIAKIIEPSPQVIDS